MRILTKIEWVVSFALFFLIQLFTAKNAKIVNCYWGTWSHFRQGDGQFRVQNIQPSLCTHISYAFFGLDDHDEVKSLRPKLDYDYGNIAKTIALKQINSNLKILASIGGGKENSTKYSAMASTATRRATFIASVMEFLQANKFDGLDLDWEYPAQRGGNLDDRENFIKLLSELNVALKTRDLLLTIAVAASPVSANISYAIPSIASYVDFINLMTYDYAGIWKRKVGFNTPLQGNGNNNIKAAINYWLQNGAPANKLVMGMAFYGRSFTLANKTQINAGAPVTGVGNPGPLTRSGGVLAYNEICAYLNDTTRWTRFFDATHLVPFAVNDNQWVGYDDNESLKQKISYLKLQNLAGAMIWSIDFDDFRGYCGETYALLKVVNNALQSEAIITNNAVIEQ